MIVVFEGTPEDWKKLLKESIREVMEESKRVAPLSISEIEYRLGITYKTVKKVMAEMNLTEVYPSDINRILVKYPKYIKKANKAEL